MNLPFDLLLIEDDLLLRDALREMLQRVGYSVLAVGHGRAGLALLAQHEVRAAITDILMPDADGYEVIMEIRHRHPHLPILAMSGGGRVGDPAALLRAARCLGCTRTIEKPFEAEEFVATVQAMLRAGCTCERTGASGAA